MSGWNHKANEIFLSALDQPESERRAFVASVCGDDDELRKQVDALLAASSRSKRFIETPIMRSPVEVVAVVPADKSPSFEVKYRLLEQIGSGGMGVVHLAEQLHPINRRVAVKLIKRTVDNPSLLARFEQERQALALMDHPNVAKVLDAGTTANGQPYLVMEYIEGEPITDYCNKNALTTSARLRLFQDVCLGLHHAHQKGIIHRDLKPTNVLVGVYDGKPVPKIIDFGVAKVIGETVPHRSLEADADSLVGTLEYMSPEQASFESHDIDTRADIYSAGVILYELLTSLAPHERERLRSVAWDGANRIVRIEERESLTEKISSQDALRKSSEERQFDPKTLLRSLKDDLEFIVQRCLAKDRDRRYSSASELAKDIERYLNHEPIEARPASSFYRVRKFVHRNRISVVAAALVTVSVIAGVIGTTAGLIRAESARIAESQQRARAEKARDRAWEALESMTSIASSQSLARQEEVSPEQKRFLRRVLSYFRELSEESPDDDATRKKIADAARRVGYIEFLIGRFNESAAAYKRAVELYGSLVADHPNEIEFRKSLANAHHSIAMAYGRKSVAEHERFHIEKAIAVAEETVSMAPSNYACLSDLASYYRSMGMHYGVIGKHDLAEKYLSRAIERLEKLIDQKPDNDENLFTLAHSLSSLAGIARTRKQMDLAEKHFRRSVALHESIDRGAKSPPRRRLYLGIGYQNLGQVLCDNKKANEGEAYLRKGFAIQKRLAERFPAVADYQVVAARTALNLANRAGEKGDRREQRRLLEISIETFERILVDSPGTPRHDTDLGGAYCNLGLHLYETGRTSESIPWFDKAIAILNESLKSDSRVLKARQFMYVASRSRALARERFSQWSAAYDDWTKAIEMSGDANRPMVHAQSLYSLARMGKVHEAIAEVDKCIQSQDWPASYEFKFACIFAFAGTSDNEQSQKFEDRAMTLLTKSINRGLENVKTSLERDDFRHLKQRPEFIKLYREAQRTGNRKPRT